MLATVPNETPHSAEPDAATRDRYPRELDALGFDERSRALFGPLGAEGFLPGRVSRIDRGLPLVLTERGLLRAEPATHLREAADGPMAVGDWVALALPEGHDAAIVEAILPRSSAFVRKDPGEHTLGQVIAANIDTVFIVQALAPGGPNLSRLERELVLAWESGAIPAVVLTKADLSADPQGMRDEVAAVALGVAVHVTSAVTGEGIDDLHDHIKPGHTVAFFGASGVGKSTLINRLMGAQVQQTAEVREYDGKGRHTTVAREMFFLPQGGILIDTPGMRALALWEAEGGMSSAFPDIEGFAAGCRFADCAHTQEPGCGVRAAVASGELPERRLASYLRLREELQRISERQDVRARSEKKKADKATNRAAKRPFKGRGQ